ncbi:hypothetical protein D3C80_2057090 [compost metagenome]
MPFFIGAPGMAYVRASEIRLAMVTMLVNANLKEARGKNTGLTNRERIRGGTVG